MNKKNGEEKLPLKDIIMSAIFIIWFIGSIVALAVLSKINGYYTVMVFGQYFFVFGLIPLFSKEKGKAIGIPFVLVGLACMIIPYLMMNPDLLDIAINWDFIIVLLLISAFIVTGLLLVIIPIIKTKKLKEKCNIEVSAMIIENDRIYNDGKSLYCPIYEFLFNGKKYNVSNNQYKNFNIKPVGTIVNIKINPNDPEEFFDNNSMTLFCIILGITFLILSIPVLIIFLKNNIF